jgi:membrane-associated phospholipid phosphatase
MSLELAEPRNTEQAMRPEAFWCRPSWPNLLRALVLGSGVSAWWVLIYHGTDWLTNSIPYRVRLHFDAELEIPYVPSSVVIYMSIYLLFVAAPFILRHRDELDRLATTQAVIILVAGFFFLAIPAEPYFRTPADPSAWDGLVRFAKRAALRHNFAPSLHVGLCVVCIIVYARRAPSWGRTLLWGWSLAVGVSTLLLHQHYVIDVIGGYLLGWAGVRCAYDRWGQGRGPETTPASRSTNPGLPA